MGMESAEATPPQRASKSPPVDLRAAARLSERVLARAMGELGRYVLEDGTRINPNRWKAVAARDDTFQVFGERNSRARSARSLPALLVSGKVRGRVESALFATATDSQEQLALLNAFLFGEDVIKGDVVAAVKQPGPPPSKYSLPSAALPAAQAEFCGGKALVKQIASPRDQVVAKLEFLEHRGYTQSPIGGELVSFFILIPISERVKSGRTSVSASRLDVGTVEEVEHVESLCCLFRQVSDDIVDVFLYASADLSRGTPSRSGGKFAMPGASLISVDSLLNVANLLECAEIKRLTAMKRESQQSVLIRSNNSKPNECSMCRQKKKLFGGATAFTACEVCGNYVCGRCRIDKRVFVPRLSRGGLGGGIMEKISACKPCSMAASSGPAASNPMNGPTMVLSERVRINRAGSRNGGPSSSSSSSLGSQTRSRTGSSGTSSSGSTASSIGTRLVYYEGDFSVRSRTNSSLSSAGQRITRTDSCATPRSAAGSVPPSPVHRHKFVDHTPQLGVRQRRHESFEGMMPSRAAVSSPRTDFPPTSRRYHATKERARSEDWVSSGSDTSTTAIRSEPLRPRQYDQLTRFTPTVQMPASRTRPESAEALVPVRSASWEDGNPTRAIVPTYGALGQRKRTTTAPVAPVHAPEAPRGVGVGPQDFMERMMELNKLAERNYDTAQRNGAMMASHLRRKY